MPVQRPLEFTDLTLVAYYYGMKEGLREGKETQLNSLGALITEVYGILNTLTKHYFFLTTYL